MAWLETLPEAHVTRSADYFDMREDPLDPDGVEVQRHTVVVSEYVGVTKAVADAVEPATYANGTLAVERVSIGAGGYTVITTLDYTTGDWTATKYTVS